jgi:transposase-like protein
MYSRSNPRRRHGAELKAAVLAACNEPGASVAAVAQAHGLNANLVHQWRRGRGTAAATVAAAAAAPVPIIEATAACAATPTLSLWSCRRCRCPALYLQYPHRRLTSRRRSTSSCAAAP